MSAQNPSLGLFSIKQTKICKCPKLRYGFAQDSNFKTKYSTRTGKIIVLYRTQFFTIVVISIFSFLSFNPKDIPFHISTPWRLTPSPRGESYGTSILRERQIWPIRSSRGAILKNMTVISTTRRMTPTL
jgi:hypothetical protein